MGWRCCTHWFCCCCSCIYYRCSFFLDCECCMWSGYCLATASLLLVLQLLSVFGVSVSVTALHASFIVCLFQKLSLHYCLRFCYLTFSSQCHDRLFHALLYFPVIVLIKLSIIIVFETWLFPCYPYLLRLMFQSIYLCNRNGFFNIDDHSKNWYCFKVYSWSPIHKWILQIHKCSPYCIYISNMMSS